MNSYRTKKCDSDDADSSASEDGDAPLPKVARPSNGQSAPKPLGAAKGNAWSEFLLDQTLSQGLTAGVGVVSGCRVMRAVESYEAPPPRRRSGGRRGFGGRYSRGGRSRGARGNASSSSRMDLDEPANSADTLPVDDAASTDNDNPFDEVARERVEEVGVKTDRSSVGGGRKRRLIRGRGRGRGSWLPRVEAPPRPSLGELDATSPSSVLGAQVAALLDERKVELIVRAVEVVGGEAVLRIFNQTRAVQADGGMMIANGSRRRTPGGVFLFLLRQDDTIPKEAKDKMWEADRIPERQFKKAKRLRVAAMCASESFESGLTQLQQMVAQKRSDSIDSAGDAKLKELPTAADALLSPPESTGETEDGEILDAADGGVDVSDQMDATDLPIV